MPHKTIAFILLFLQCFISFFLTSGGNESVTQHKIIIKMKITFFYCNIWKVLKKRKKTKMLSERGEPTRKKIISRTRIFEWKSWFLQVFDGKNSGTTLPLPSMHAKERAIHNVPLSRSFQHSYWNPEIGHLSHALNTGRQLVGFLYQLDTSHVVRFEMTYKIRHIILTRKCTSHW